MIINESKREIELNLNRMSGTSGRSRISLRRHPMDRSPQTILAHGYAGLLTYQVIGLRPLLAQTNLREFVRLQGEHPESSAEKRYCRLYGQYFRQCTLMVRPF